MTTTNEFVTKRVMIMKTILIAAALLSGCAITPDSTTDKVLTTFGRVLAAKAASGGGYNWQQGLRDGQQQNQAWMEYANRIHQQQMQNDSIFGQGGMMNPINVRMQQ